jgi:hypothetical protein
MRVADIEKRLGFVSSFNFVPQRYVVPAETRKQLQALGLEVGVHDLRHDGSLYRSRKAFSERATQINRYLAAWDVVGFRSGSMCHNLEWIKDLNIEYDCSTFDTDPFEPQPDGMRTIFPLVVEDACADRSYVELPYTLPQDLTVFVLLGHDGPHVWEEKLSWIAARGGMALLNCHPDYMKFDDGRRKIDEYPAEHYESFLRHVLEKYPGKYWNALPRDAAAHCRAVAATNKANR